MRADLHIHTSASDGLKTPREAAEHMHGLGVELISVTDHDTVSGLDEAAEECRALGVRFVPGIEISAHSNSEIHILGYNIDYKNPDFCEQIAKVKDMRRARNLLIGEKLAGCGVELGIDFSSDGLGRMNIARLMVEKGYAKDVQDAFNRYLGPNGKAYSDVRRTSPLEAVKLIAAFGGVPVLAHPKKYLQQKTLRLLVEGLRPFGLKGIEVYYPTQRGKFQSQFKTNRRRKNECKCTRFFMLELSKLCRSAALICCDIRGRGRSACIPEYRKVLSDCRILYRLSDC